MQSVVFVLRQNSSHFLLNFENLLYIETRPVSYTHLRAHETKANLVCRLLLEKKNKQHFENAHNQKLHNYKSHIQLRHINTLLHATLNEYDNDSDTVPL